MTDSPQSSTTPRLKLTGISKSFPGVLANDDVNLEVLPGQIHALLGENGAGKSTLVKMIYGLLKPDNGEIAWEGKNVNITSPNFARRLGVGMVFQHFSLFDAMTVTENIALALDKQTALGDLEKRIIDISTSYGLALDPKREVHTLSVGEKQRIEIVRCLLQDPRLLIMDEPTSVLTPQEVEKLFETLRLLSTEGRSILYISHKLDEIKSLCEWATILRGGRVVNGCDPREETVRSLAEMMIGSTLTTPAAKDVKNGEVKLQVKNLSRPAADDFATSLNEIDFSVQAGEVFGIAGVAGNGQGELLEVLSGEVLMSGGVTIEIDGTQCQSLGINARRDLGLTYVPEERLGHGAVPQMSLTDNTVLSAHRRKQLTNKQFIQYVKARAFGEQICEEFRVKQSGVESHAASLSGGNLQKFIVGREMLQAPAVLIASQPTWGVDAGSAAAIHQALLDLAEAGAAVLIVSQDLDELMLICDRIAVLFEGSLSDAQAVVDCTAESLGLLMGGVGQVPEQHAA